MIKSISFQMTSLDLKTNLVVTAQAKPFIRARGSVARNRCFSAFEQFVELN